MGHSVEVVEMSWRLASNARVAPILHFVIGGASGQLPARTLYRSFGYAARGFWIARTGRNLRIHLVATAAVLFLVVAYGLTGSRLGLVVVSVTAVISAELMNTAVERLCDLVAILHGIGVDTRIRDIKDLAAGAVLVVALGAAVNGVIVFGPLLA